MGLLDFIRHNLPESWEHVLTKNKIKTEVCKRIHNNIPKRYRNRYHTKEAMVVARRLLRASSIIYAMDNHMDDPAFWSEIQHQINMYEDSLK